MARQIGKLTALVVTRLKEKGVYPDGGNLYLQISASGSKSWLFRYMRHGKARSMGLGSVNAVSLADARIKAAECRKLLADDIDPIEARKEKVAEARLAAAQDKTFRKCAEDYIKAHESSWKNEKHRWQWENTLERFVYPTLGKLPVQDIDVALVMKVLEPIWKEKTETATRVRGRIESILDRAAAREYRQGENPARWRGRLENLLPRPSKVKKVEHHPALPYSQINAFLTDLEKEQGVSTAALKFLILTATRTSETIGAKWREFDLDEGVWIIPASRIKAGREHRVPLSNDAIAIIRHMKHAKNGDYVFPGRKTGRPLSNMAMLTLLRRMNHTEFTVHGFRSSFRDWAAEQTN